MILSQTLGVYRKLKEIGNDAMAYEVVATASSPGVLEQSGIIFEMSVTAKKEDIPLCNVRVKYADLSGYNEMIPDDECTWAPMFEQGLVDIQILDGHSRLSSVNTILTAIEETAEALTLENMYEMIEKVNNHGFSPVVYSVGDFNTVTVAGDVPGFNTFARLQHLASGAFVNIGIDEAVLGIEDVNDITERDIVVQASDRIDSESLANLLSLADVQADEKQDIIAKIRESVKNDAIEITRDVLVPCAKSAASSLFSIHIGAGISDDERESESV